MIQKVYYDTRFSFRPLLPTVDVSPSWGGGMSLPSEMYSYSGGEGHYCCYMELGGLFYGGTATMTAEIVFMRVWTCVFIRVLVWGNL